MEDIGLNPRFINEATLYEGLHIGRVISQYKNLYKVIIAKGELMAEMAGKFNFKVKTAADFPAVGDFVMLDRDDDSSGNAIIHHVLTRRSAFIRKAAGTAHDEQVVAANIDTVFICMSLNNDFNLRRVERYLAIAWNSGANPVIVLTKSDLCSGIDDKLAELSTVALGAEVLLTSSMSEDGYLPVKKYIESGQTIAFIGSSGVGKSTLINKLIGENIIATNELRNDDKGRHTTTRREMYILPGGGVVIDTPGMREIGLEGADIGKTFVDIEELSAQCRFSNCTHSKEPHCAVQEAINSGLLTEERWENYLRLKKEAKYEGLNSRQIEHEKLNDMFKDIGGIKGARKLIKAKAKK